MQQHQDRDHRPRQSRRQDTGGSGTTNGQAIEAQNPAAFAPPGHNK